MKKFNSIKEIEAHMVIAKAKAVFLGIVCFFVAWYIIGLLGHSIIGFFIAFFVAAFSYLVPRTSFTYEEFLPFSFKISSETIGKIAAILSGITKTNYKVDDEGKIRGPLKMELSKISAQTIGAGTGYGGLNVGVGYTGGHIKPSKEEIGETTILINKKNNGTEIQLSFEIASHTGGTGANIVENLISVLKSILAQQKELKM